MSLERDKINIIENEAAQAYFGWGKQSNNISFKKVVSNNESKRHIIPEYC